MRIKALRPSSSQSACAGFRRPPRSSAGSTRRKTNLSMQLYCVIPRTLNAGSSDTNPTQVSLRWLGPEDVRRSRREHGRLEKGERERFRQWEPDTERDREADPNRGACLPGLSQPAHQSYDHPQMSAPSSSTKNYQRCPVLK